MRRRTFMTGMALAAGGGLAVSPAAQAAVEGERFSSVHADLFRRFRSTASWDECGRASCDRSIDDIRQTMRGNCRDFGVLLIDECLQANLRDVVAVWCRCSGVAHLVVMHVPSVLVADNQLPEARLLTRRPDLEQLRMLWPVPTRETWVSQGKNW